LSKIAENCDHNIDPWYETSGLGNFMRNRSQVEAGSFFRCRKQQHNGEMYVGSPGVDVMIIIFCHFQQFLAKKLAFFTKTNVMINFLQNLALF
jgi:hypothetical protein